MQVTYTYGNWIESFNFMIAIFFITCMIICIIVNSLINPGSVTVTSNVPEQSKEIDNSKDSSETNYSLSN